MLDGEALWNAVSVCLGAEERGTQDVLYILVVEGVGVFFLSVCAWQ